MANLFALGVELLASVTFLLLWFQDRTRTYLLWWAASEFTLPCLSLLGMLLRGSDPVAAHAASFAYGPVAVMLVISQIKATLLYRGSSFSNRRLGAIALALLLTLAITQLIASTVATRGAGALLVGAAFAITAALLWPAGRFERYTAIALASRALLSVAIVAMIIGTTSGLTRHIPVLSGVMAVVTAVLLVVTVFNRLLSDLREQYKSLSISQELSTALQGLMDEKELARRVVDLFVRRGKWDLCALAIYSPVHGDFEIGYASGMRLAIIPKPWPRLPCSGLAGLAFQSRQPTHSLDVASDPRITPAMREMARKYNTVSQICIPVLHDETALGVLILTAASPRALFSHEMQTMESLGKIVGMGLTHLRNLATMAFRANHDSLTGLDNRAALHEWFGNRQADLPATLMLFDLNGFKEVNDALGHSVGDRLLQALAQRLRESLASEQVHVYRLGGDEFVILYEDLPDAANNALRANQLAELIALPFYIDEVCLRTSASIGIAEAPTHGKSSHELLRCADLAMYQAKNNGSTIAFYEQGRDDDVRDRIHLVSGIIDGLERNEFELYYQPLVNLQDGSCRSCEALLRWQHPERGLLTAGAFMPFVEATDLIYPLTQRVIELAIRDAAAWQTRGAPIKVSINLSARNLLDADLPDQLLRLIHQHKLEPAYIQLEITETVLMKDPISATAVMQQLRDAGFMIALDDFGTGYSSLAYLARFPINKLKIDQSFVRDMLEDGRSRAIVQSTVELAHMLDLSVAAEGIETVAEQRLLTEFGCDLGQGYHFARPLPRIEFESWLQRCAQNMQAVRAPRELRGC